MHSICIDAWNQAGIDETTFTVRTAGGGGERNDATIKIATLCFEPGITKRDLKGSRIVKECSPTIRTDMGDNQTSVISFSAKPGEMIRFSESPHMVKELSQTLTRSDGKLGDNQPTVIAFAQNTREEVRSLGNVAGAISASSGSHQTNYISQNSNSSNAKMKAEVRRLTPTEVQRLQGFDEGHLDVNNQGDSAKYSETGNSWAVPNARFVLKGIHKVDEKLTGKKRGFKYGTISSGVEAHTQAVEGFGDKAVFLSEIAPAPCSVLKAHYPDVPNLGDMTLVDYDADKKVINNRPYDGYTAPDKKALGFDAYKTDTPVEIPADYGEVDVVSGGTPCFTAGNMVLTPTGYRPIEDIKVGDYVISMLGRQCRVVKTGHKHADNVYRVKIGSRPEFCVTGNHPFVLSEMHRDYSRKSKTYAKSILGLAQFRAIETATKNTCAMMFTKVNRESNANCIPVVPEVYKANDIDVLELAGWYVGDGYVRSWKGKSKKAVILCLNEDKLNKFRDRFGSILNFTVSEGRTAFKVQICCTALANWLVKWFSKLAIGKTMPTWMYNVSKEYRTAFLVGYSSTDGCLTGGDLSFTTISKSLAFGVADLIGEARVYESKMPETCVIEGRVCHQHTQYIVRKSLSESNKFHHEGNDTFVKVRSVVPTDPAEVYNLEVENDHTYVCNGFCVHNCQDLSVAGKRKGAVEGSNTRSSLAFQLPRIGAAVGAKFIVWENVAGAFSSNGGRDFAWLLHRMTEYGYTSLAWRCMDAQYIRTDKHPRGVPQRRRRVWIVGYRGDDWRVPCEALFEPMKVLGNEPPKRTVGVGYLPYVDKLRKAADAAGAAVDKSELKEFNDFVAGATKSIIDCLVAKGVCESVEDRVRELTEKSAESEPAVFDLFCADGESHQGRGLRAADLELGLPATSDIRSLPQYQIYEWAKTVSKEVIYIGDMFKGDCEVDNLQPKLLENIGNAGFLCKGLICTMKMPEWNAGVTEEELATMPADLAALYDGDVCGLSDVLEDNPDPKYKLSWRACYGILRRAVNRGKKLPIELGYALVERIVEQAMFVKWSAMNGKDTIKKEGDLSERQIAKICYDDFIEAEWHWADVKEEEQKKSADDSEDDGFAVDDEEDPSETEDAEA